LRPQHTPLKSDINVTPLVDVMLVLLIIFMLVTPMLEQSIEVDLPEARNITPLTDPDRRTITLTLRDNGEVYLDRKAIDAGNIALELQTVRAQKPLAVLHVKADRSLSYGVVKTTFRTARRAGFADAYLLATEKPENEKREGADEDNHGPSSKTQSSMRQ